MGSVARRSSFDEPASFPVRRLARAPTARRASFNRAFDAPGHNLPVQVTSFVGRERELVEIRRLLPRTRLLTLTGPGGVGKTRLPLELAGRLVGRYPDGVWLVELATLSDPSLVSRAVASVLAVREQPGRPLDEDMVEALRARRLLLVVDNCEHLVAACAQLVHRLIGAAPGLRVVATSREPLAIPGETTWRVPGLALPAARSPTMGGDGAELAVGNPAVRLFLDRARTVEPSFPLNARAAAAVAEICRRLDGMPLAIELAAARVGVLSVEQIAARLDDRFHLLTGGSRAALPRHRTLRALIDWSHDLLSVEERTLLRRLSIFVGGWTLEAAEGVSGLARAEVLDLLAQLTAKSLVIAEDRDGEKRYRLLETIREYAAQKLVQAGEQQEIRTRHRDWFLALAERAEPELSGADQVAWLDRLERDYDNLRLVLGQLAEPDRPCPAGAAQDARAGLRLGWALMRFWDMRGHLAEGRAWLAKLLAADSEARPSSARARALFAAGRLAYQQGDYAAAAAAGTESLALARQVDDAECAAFALTQIGHVHRIRGDLEAARRLYEESLDIRSRLEAHGAATFPAGVAISLKCLGGVAHARGDLPLAKERYAEALARERKLGHRWEIALSLHRLGEIAIDLGDLAEARRRLEEALAVASGLRDRQTIALVLGGIAGLAAAGGEPERRSLPRPADLEEVGHACPKARQHLTTI